MGCDKAFVEIHGVPLWQRQWRILRTLGPHKIFVAGPVHPEWTDAFDAIVPDAQENAGPLAALVASLRRCSTPLLLALAIDLPRTSADYLRDLIAHCTGDVGTIPYLEDRFEPLVAVYPISALRLAENCLRSGNYSLQRFAAGCVSEGIAHARQIEPSQESLFLNMNTPEDLAIAADRVV
jgi:molybdopterin-guanine dinucleotide biosynthesis protein A